MPDGTRKAASRIPNPFVNDRAHQCDLISPISVAERLDDEKLESQCDEAFEEMSRSPQPSSEK